MKRSALISLKDATKCKQQQICELLNEYRVAVNFYIFCCWNSDGRLDAITLRKLTNSPLSYRYKSQALKQADGIVRGTLKAAKEAGSKATMPVFRGGADLSTNFLNLSFVGNEFDCWARLSTLAKGKPIWLLTRKTRVFNKWMERGTLIAGGTLFERRGVFYIKVSFEIEETNKSPDNTILGIDRGVTNLLATSEGKLIGKDIGEHIERIKRRVPKSRGRKQAFKARDQYINECLKQLPFSDYSLFVIEELKGIKHKKKGKLRKATNRRFSHWTVGAMGERLSQLCEEHAVQLQSVPARYTSRYCRQCGCVEKGNRRGEVFSCVRCNHTDHADLSAAQNIRDVFLGTISVPHAKVQKCKL